MLIISRILALTFMLVWLILVFGYPLGVKVEQVINPSWFEQMVYKLAGTGEIQLRVMGAVVLVGLVISTYKFVCSKLDLKNRWAAWLTAANLPWIYILALNHVGESISVIGMNLFLIGTGGEWGKLIWLIVMGTTSAAGWWGAVGLAIIQLLRKKWRYGLVILILAGLAYPRSEFINNLTPAKLADKVNQEKKLIYLAADRSEVMPGWLGKITYNKVGFGLEALIKKTVSAVDPTMWTAVRPAWAITKLADIPPKGIWDTLYYWQIPLGVLGLSGGIILAVALIPLVMADFPLVNSAGALLIPLLALSIARGTIKFSKVVKFGGYALLTLNIVAFGYLARQVFFQTSQVQDTRVTAYREIYEVYKQLSLSPNKLVITDRLGPTEMMLNFYTGGLPKTVKVAAFDLAQENPLPGRIYIGFTREFTGDSYLEDETKIPTGKILNQINLADEPVYKFGRTIWVVEP